MIMSLNFLRTALAVSLIMSAGLARAEDPVITREWQTDFIRVGFNDSVPSNCVMPTVAATNSWNAVGADFYHELDLFTRHPLIANQTAAFNGKNITIEPSDDIRPDAVMSTRLDPDPSGAGNLVNADIRVNRRILEAGDISCSTAEVVPADKVDWESAILHEFGHGIGFVQDVNEPTCSMHWSLTDGEKRRVLCAAEKQAYIDAYGKKFKILSIPNVSGPQQTDIPAKVIYEGTPVFPVERRTKYISCPSGWSCSNYNGTYSSATSSTLTFNFRCDPSVPLPTATFQWRTTLIDANGKETDSVDHTSTCTKPPGTLNKNSGDKPTGINRVIITN